MKFLAAKIILLVCLLIPPSISHTAGIPVIDSSNLPQNLISAIENVYQTLKQIEEYQTQLQQYQRQMEDALNFDDFIWSDADFTITEMLGLMDSINGIKDTVKGVNYYLTTIEDGLTLTELEDIYKQTTDVNMAENETIDEFIDTIDNQQTKISEDATILMELQGKAERGGDVGQMQAIQTANMLSSHMANQILQLRALLVAQGNADAAYKLKLNNEEALKLGATKNFRAGEFIKSTPKSF